MRPRALVQAWVEAFNRGDADAGNVARQNEEARLMSVKTRKTK